jgi:hypothetical protein
MHRSTARRALALAATTVAALAASSAPAGAITFSTGASIVGSYCTDQHNRIGWWGGYPYEGVFPESHPRGTVYVCWYKHRLDDRDGSADYYAMTAVSQWYFTGGGRNYPAYMSQDIKSNTTSRDNVYSATGSFSSNRSCSETFGVTFGTGMVSATVPIKMCSGYAVTRRSYSSTGAFWDSPKAGGLNRIETAFIQKVPQGVVPRFNVTFGIPQYTNSWTGNAWRSTARIVYQSFTGK